MLDEFWMFDVLLQRRLTHSLNPPCSMRNTLKTAKKQVKWTVLNGDTMVGTLTVSAGDHDVRMLFVQRQRVRGAVVQNVSLVVGRHFVVRFGRQYSLTDARRLDERLRYYSNFRNTTHYRLWEGARVKGIGLQLFRTPIVRRPQSGIP